MASSGAAKPTLRRQIVNPDQTQEFQDFTDSQRVPNPPSNPYTFTITHGSGAVISIDSSGNINITAKSGQLVTVKANDVVLNAADKVSLLAPTVAMNGNLQVSGSVIGGFSGSDQVNLQTHRHGVVGTPVAAQTIPPTAGT
jgi:phage baseplate assembly protein gpV